MNLRFLLVIPLILTCNGALAADSAPNAGSRYHVIKTVPLGGDGSWDYLTADSGARRLYIARSNRVMVVDLDTHRLIGEIGGMSGVHGVSIVPQLKRGFITSGKDGTVRVFDLTTLKETAQVKAGQKPDAITYDPASQKIFAFNHGGTTATVIDPATVKAIGEVELGGSPESAVADGKGNVFANLEDKSEVVAIDTAKLAVTARWPLAPGTEPTGLAIDTEHRRLFSGCHNDSMIILDADTGKVISHLPIGSGVDAAIFDPSTDNAFSSNGDGTLTVIHEVNPSSFSVVHNVKTQEGARTLALDTNTHRIWLVTATMTNAPNGTAPQNRQHKVVAPGSFAALIVGR